MKYFYEAKENFLKGEEILSEYATKSIDAIRLNNISDDISAPFFR